jgi:hypothetical protein
MLDWVMNIEINLGQSDTHNSLGSPTFWSDCRYYSVDMRPIALLTDAQPRSVSGGSLVGKNRSAPSHFHEANVPGTIETSVLSSEFRVMAGEECVSKVS